MSLPTDYQTYYVYTHTDPLTGKIKYVGMGSGSRAWSISSSGKDNTRYGHRTKEHSAWYKTLESAGFTLADIVTILHSNLSKSEALQLEQHYISVLGYSELFNKNPKDRKSKFTDNIKESVLALRNMGYSIGQISYILGADTLVSRKNTKQMFVWRILNA